MSFVRKFGDNYDKELIDTATKTGVNAAKTAEATGDLIGNKIADKITPVGKAKENLIPPEKRQEITEDLKLFWAQNVVLLYKNSISKKCKFSWYNMWW